MSRDRSKEKERGEMLRAKTRHNKKYGAAPPHGMGHIKCEICGKPLSKHTIMKMCDGT